MAKSTQRKAKEHRVTAETDVAVEIDVDGSGKTEIETGIAFLDHMLTLFGKHALLDLTVKARGDIEVDYHHTVEDVGIVLGKVLREALGTKEGINRYGWCLLPMDETLARVALDFSGRAYLQFDVPGQPGPVRDFEFSLVEEFWRGFTHNAACNLHAAVLYGRDSHHMAEALFKGVAKCVLQAATLNPRVEGVLSTKETLS